MATFLEISMFNVMDGPISSASAGALADVIPLGANSEGTMRGIRIPVGWGQSTRISVRPGRYLVQAVLPSGELLESQVEINDGEQREVRLEGHTMPHEWLGWQRFTASPHVLRSRTSTAADGRDVPAPKVWFAEGPWLLLSGPNYRSLRPWSDADQIRPAQSDPWISLFEFRDGQSLSAAVIRRGAHLERVSLPLPWGRHRRATVQLAVPHDPSLPLSIAVTDSEFGPLLGYIGSGGLPSAYQMLRKDPEQWFTDLLEDKLENPYAAAIAGYLMIVHAKDQGPQRWHPWIENLARWFPRLPDGAVLQGWLCMQQGLPYMHWFDESMRRGMPFMTGTIRMLFDGLLMSQGGNDRRTVERNDREVLSFLRGILAHLDPTQPFSTLRYDQKEMKNVRF